jgi:3-oxoacyl-[acyl-carrier-protein] synthase II
MTELGGARAIAFGAVSALGVGRDAFDAGEIGAPARVAIATDAAFTAAGFARPFAARATADLRSSARDRATALLGFALAEAIEGLDRIRPSWRGERVGVAIGTSSGGMESAERFFAARASGTVVTPELARAATYFAPFDDALAATDLAALASKKTQVLAACSASAIALGLALRWLDRGACEVVFAGGYDALTVFVAAGFEVLRATTASRPRPFRIGRDGMSLGEGAAIVALVREADAREAPAFLHLAGFGASGDAVHITAPDRTGAGLARAARAALDDARLEPARVGLISAHATATPYNDAMESRALATVFGDAPRPIVHPFKAQIGHTLGAAGVLEALAAADALSRSLAPAAAGEGELDPDASVELAEVGAPGASEAALKLAAAFGGSNAALVLTRTPSERAPATTARPSHATAWANASDVSLDALAAATGIAKDRLARLDALCRLGLAAVIALADRCGGRDALAGAGLVAGHALATLETNAAFDARLRARGPRLADPRLFPATSPNAIAGECAIAFQLTGPLFSVGAGLDGGAEALAAAAEIVASGAAEKMIAVAADDVGEASRALLAAAGWADRPCASGAFAVLVEATPRAGSLTIAPDLPLDHTAGPIGHLGLSARFASANSR